MRDEEMPIFPNLLPTGPCCSKELLQTSARPVNSYDISLPLPQPGGRSAE